MTHGDRPRGPSGRREAAGDAAHRQGFPLRFFRLRGGRKRPRRAPRQKCLVDLHETSSRRNAAPPEDAGGRT